MVKRIAWIAVIVVAALAAYLALWPVPIRPVAWQAPAAPGYAGAHAVNQRLAGLQMIDLGGEVGPEHVALGPDGRLYVAVASGNILRMVPDGSAREVFANTGGRVLGFAFDAAGNLVAADAVKGLLSVTPDGRVTLLADKRRRRADPLCGRRRRRRRRPDLLHRRVDALRPRRLGRHLRGERARHHRADGDRPRARLRPGDEGGARRARAV